MGHNKTAVSRQHRQCTGNIVSPIRITLLLLVALLLTTCNSGIISKTVETTGNVAASISNLPSTVLPNQFRSTAFVDSDFRIPNAAIEADGEYTVVRTFFATNRSVSGSANPLQSFGDRSGDAVTFGKSYVILRRAGDTFEVEPESLIKVNLGDEPEQAATLAHNEIFTRRNFAEELNTAINRATDNSLIIFVHGFNVNFTDAAIMSAQLNYDLGYSGTTVFYSWPARGDYPTYIADTESALASQRQFETMINEVMYGTNANKIYLVAVGLGANLASKALKSVLHAQPALRSRLRELVLVAPDIAEDEFTQDLIPYLGTTQSPVTLYASSRNSALNTSKSLHDYPLAGDSSDRVLITRQVETIDAGTANVSLASHSGYADTNSILADIRGLILNGLRANSRLMLTARYPAHGTTRTYARTT